MLFLFKIVYPLILTLLFLFNFTLSVQAETIQLEKPSISRLMKPMSLMANYAYLDLWIPSKYGASFSYNARGNTTWELEYLTGRVSLDWSFFDIGTFKEEKFSVLRRKFGRSSSFNYFSGLTYSTVDITIGNAIVSNTTGIAGGRVLDLAKLNFTLGLGNRWVSKTGFTIGCDWFSLNIPIYVFDSNQDFLKQNLNPDDREDVEKVLKYLKYIPGFTILKLQLGYSF